LESHAPLSDKRLCNSFQFKLESNPETSSALIEKLGNQPTASLNDVMEHIIRVDAMLNSKKHPTSTMLKTMEGKQRKDGGGSHDRSCYVCGKLGHPIRICPNQGMVLAAWSEKKLANDEKGSDEKQKERSIRRRGSHGGHKNGGDAGRG
jgi:hypothetical protein